MKNLKKYIYFAPEVIHNGVITPTIFNSAKEVIEISSNFGNYETYYGGQKIQAHNDQIYDNYGDLLSYIENNSFWKIQMDNPYFNKRLEEIRNEYPEYFI